MLTAVARLGIPIVLLAACLWLAPDALLAATPEPSSAAGGGDPRSEGQGPGFVGDPGTAIVLVLAIGIAAALLTYAYVFLTRNQVRP